MGECDLLLSLLDHMVSLGSTERRFGYLVPFTQT